MIEKKIYKGAIIKDSIVHIYEDANDCRRDMIDWENWQQSIWINFVVFHYKGAYNVNKKYIGMLILEDRSLHLYEDANDIRDDMIAFNLKMSELKWISGVSFHEKTN